MDEQSKVCSGCGQVKARSEFYSKYDKAVSCRKVTGKCKVCVGKRTRAWQALHPKPRKLRKPARIWTTEEKLWRSAKLRAEKKGVPFTITPADIKIPDVCPALGLRLQSKVGRGGALDCSPSLDRLVPSLGYTPENIRVISYLANAIKYTASSTEILQVGEWLRSLGR